jgi:hypothetical protein
MCKYMRMYLEREVYWVVEANLAPTWRSQPGNLARAPTWPNLATVNLAKPGQPGSVFIKRNIHVAANLALRPTWRRNYISSTGNVSTELRVGAAQPGDRPNLATWRRAQPGQPGSSRTLTAWSHRHVSKPTWLLRQPGAWPEFL